MNHYDSLEVSPVASPETIRAAYRSLMQRHHPDKHPQADSASTVDRAAAIANAYEVLSDPARRAQYDLGLRASSSWAHQSPVPPAGDQSTHAVRGRTELSAEHVAPAGGWTVWLAATLVIALLAWGAVALLRPANPARELDTLRQTFGAADSAEALRRQIFERKSTLLAQHAILERQALREQAENMAERSFTLLEAPLKVRLGGESSVAGAELTVPVATVIVGSFDSASLLAQLSRHRERAVEAVAARLAQEDPRGLGGVLAEQRLRRVVQDSVSSSLGADPSQEYPSTWFESPGRYGVVDVLLPQGFRLN